MSEFKIIQYNHLNKDKKYLIHYYQDDNVFLYTCYYDGTIKINQKTHVIFKKLKDIYGNITPLKVYIPNSIKIYNYYSKKEMAQNNMENRALVKIFKKIIGDENFDIGMKLSNVQPIHFDVLN